MEKFVASEFLDYLLEEFSVAEVERFLDEEFEQILPHIQLLNEEYVSEKITQADEIDDANRNSKMLKGNFPWGKVSAQLTKSMVGKLKQIQKPADRLRAMDKIWSDRKHFGDLLSGKLEIKEPKKTKKNSITLPKITGID